MDEKTVLRARDFWTSIVLISVSCFFLFETTSIAFLNTEVAGVDAADWYNSAALVPYGIFLGLLVLSIGLMVISIRDGGAKHALSSAGLGISGSELARSSCVCLMLSLYLVGLVPRVDFIISSAILITALVWGFHKENRASMWICTAIVAAVSVYALVMNFPRSQWTKPHDDDWVALGGFLFLTAVMFVNDSRAGKISSVTKLIPVISVLVPLVLVSAMAFGFRQNVPNRTGLLFSNLEYHYYVTLRPLWRGL